MSERVPLLFALVGVTAVLGITGCSGGSGSGTASGSGRATVLLTDSPREDFAHVWATIYHVELVTASGQKAVVFDDTTGKLIDLKTLRDASGERYNFLSSTAVPSDTYTSVNVTVGPTMQLFKSGTAVGDPLPVDDSLPKDALGRPVVTLTFASPKTLGTGTTTSIVLDFDLARFVLRNSKVVPALQEGASAGLKNPDRHNKDDYRGTVSAVTGNSPDLSFTLTRRDGSTVAVTTSSATSLYGPGTLADGGMVVVRGTLDTTNQTLVATSLEVLAAGAGETQQTPRLFGTASDLDATAGTFTLTPSQAGCMTLTETTVNVVTTADTVYRADAGTTHTQADFFTALATTSTLSVEGTYDTSSNTLTATSVKIVDGTQDGGWQPGANHFRHGMAAGNWSNGTLHN